MKSKFTPKKFSLGGNTSARKNTFGGEHPKQKITPGGEHPKQKINPGGEHPKQKFSPGGEHVPENIDVLYPGYGINEYSFVNILVGSASPSGGHIY